MANSRKDTTNSEIIPKIINFIWAGSLIREIDKVRILLWEKLNPGYQIFVSVDDQFEKQTREYFANSTVKTRYLSRIKIPKPVAQFVAAVTDKNNPAIVPNEAPKSDFYRGYILKKGGWYTEPDVTAISLNTLTIDPQLKFHINAATTIGCEVGQIVKSLLFRTQKTNQPILLLVSGVNRVNEKIIEKLIGEKITKADAEFAREITGYAIGGIPPIGHKQIIPHIFIDEDLLQFEKLWGAAGTPNAVFSFCCNDLKKMVEGKIVRMKGFFST